MLVCYVSSFALIIIINSIIIIIMNMNIINHKDNEYTAG